MADENLERITILLQARDKDLQRTIDRNNKLIARATRDMRKNSEKLTRDVETHMAKIGQSVTGMSKTMIAGLAGTAITAAVGIFTSNLRSGVKAVAEIGNEAARSGLGVEAFQELSYVATQTRIPIDAVIDGIKELNLRADEFVVTGKGSAAEAFARLGLGATDLKDKLKEPDELLLEIIGKLERMDRAAQIRIADEVFGGTGGERFVELIGRGEEGLRALRDQARDAGVVMDAELVQKAAELDQKFDAITQRLSTLAKTAVVNVADAINDVLTTDVDEIFGSAERAIAMMGEANYRAMKDGAAATDDQQRSMEGLVGTYDALFRAINAATGPDGIRLMDVADIDEAYELAAILQEIDQEMRAFQNGSSSAAEFGSEVSELVDEARDLIAELDAVDAQQFGGVIGAIDGISKALQAAIRDASDLRSALPSGQVGMTYAPDGPVDFQLPPSGRAPVTSPRPELPSVDFGFGSPDPKAGGGRGGGGGAAKLSDWERELERTKEAIAQLKIESASLLVAAEYGNELGDAMEYAAKRADLLYAAQQSGREITPELTAEIDALARSYMEAGLAAEESADRLDKVKDNAKRGADALSDLFLSIMDGSKTAGDALLSLLAQIARFQFTSNIQALAESGGGGGLFAALGSLLSNARGNAFGGGMPVPFAKGGVFDSPTYFPMSGGRTGVLAEGLDDEAIMPLARGSDGKLGVRAQGGGGGSQKLQVELVGGGLTMSDDGSIMSSVSLRVAQGNAQTVKTVKQNLDGWINETRIFGQPS